MNFRMRFKHILAVVARIPGAKYRHFHLARLPENEDFVKMAHFTSIGMGLCCSVPGATTVVADEAGTPW